MVPRIPSRQRSTFRRRTCRSNGCRASSRRSIRRRMRWAICWQSAPAPTTTRGVFTSPASVTSFRPIPGDFAVSGSVVTWTNGTDWGLRRMILHYAHLCAAAGACGCLPHRLGNARTGPAMAPARQAARGAPKAIPGPFRQPSRKHRQLGQRVRSTRAPPSAAPIAGRLAQPPRRQPPFSFRCSVPTAAPRM